MGLADMENGLKDMLDSMKREIKEEDGEKRQQKPAKKPSEEIDLDDFLSDIPGLMSREKRKAPGQGGFKDQAAGRHQGSFQSPFTGSGQQGGSYQGTFAGNGQAGRNQKAEFQSPFTGNGQQADVQSQRAEFQSPFTGGGRQQAASPVKTVKGSKKLKAGERYHILLIDDDVRVLKMMKEILREDYDTAVATNGDIALKFLDRHGTDLILLDYMMPGENGKQVLERIRQNPVYYDVPVVFLTGMSDTEKVQECLALRPQGYMLKPVKQEELLKRVRSILNAANRN